MKHKINNGWSKEKMIERIKKYVPDTDLGAVLDGACSYYCEGGLRCSAGAMMSNSDYNRVIETGSQSLGIRQLMHTGIVSPQLMPLNVEGMNYLQAAHDCLFSKTAKMMLAIEFQSLDWDLSARDRCVQFVENYCEE